MSTYVALGANLPFEGVQGVDLLARAVAALRDANLAPRGLSGVWRTEAWPPGSGQPDYFNAVVEIETGDLSPPQLYEALTAIERRFGRERRERLQERAFVLAPLTEIAPDWRHPVRGHTAAELLAALPPGYRYERIGAIPAA
jgi:2-amino-4-hydroxy-6-hydroxymethyldihydropteridine diphosphokinase